jgi:hypothetical protein
LYAAKTHALGLGGAQSLMLSLLIQGTGDRGEFFGKDDFGLLHAEA